MVFLVNLAKLFAGIILGPNLYKRLGAGRTFGTSD